MEMPDLEMAAAVTEVRKLERAGFCCRENCPRDHRGEVPLPPGPPVSRVIKRALDQRRHPPGSKCDLGLNSVYRTTYS
jgi:hypothetical protein